MNFGVDGLDPHAEDSWIGRRVQLGDAVIVPQGNVGRCAITTQNPETGRPDLDTLKALARYRSEAPTTEPLPFGIHAAVAEPGRVRARRPGLAAVARRSVTNARRCRDECDELRRAQHTAGALDDPLVFGLQRHPDFGCQTVVERGRLEHRPELHGCQPR